MNHCCPGLSPVWATAVLNKTETAPLTDMFFMQSNGDLKRKWTWAVEWLGDELERRPYTGNPQYTYNNWSPPVQSNETSNGYFLERSHSARMTLAKACELCPEEVMALSLFPIHTHTHKYTYIHTLPDFQWTLCYSVQLLCLESHAEASLLEYM